MSLFCALVEGFIGDFGRETDIDVRGGAPDLRDRSSRDVMVDPGGMRFSLFDASIIAFSN